MNIFSTIKKLSSGLPIGSSNYYDCPICGGIKKLGITRYSDKILYRCFRASCTLKASAIDNVLNKNTLDAILNKKPIGSIKEFCLPDYLIDGFASQSSIRFAMKYNLLSSYQQGLYKTAFDPRLNRQVFYYLDSKGSIVGAMGRALNYLIKPKAYVYPNSEKSVWILEKSLDTAIIVEDILSAIAVGNCNVTGIALSGTTLSMDYIPQLNKYNKIIIALDKDAAIKSLSIRKLLQYYVKDVRILLIEKDFKDMTIEEIKKVVKYD